MRKAETLASVAVWVLAGAVTSAHATRFHDYTKQYKTPPDPVKVEMASCIGSDGTEWLVGGGFLKDGTLVLGGTTLGPTLDIGGKSATVLGSDRPAPAGYTPGKDGKGNPVSPTWRTADGTAWLAWVAPDLKTVKRTVRFPWKSGTANSVVVGADGSIYVVGVVASATDALGEARDVSAEEGGDAKAGAVFVAKVDPAGTRIQWVRRFADAGKGPSARLLKDGSVAVEGGWVYVFKPDGELASVAKVHKTKNWARGVDPVDWSYALGFDRNTHTGREPWRQPHLVVTEGPGALGEVKADELYAWDPKLVGSDTYRLVSDSSFRHLYYDDDGMLYAVGWSDGGNTVLERQPKNLDQGIPSKGLGFSSWGAGALSLTHLIKMNPATREVTNKTLWCGFLKGKESPSSAGVSHLGVATDGSLLMSGGTAFGLIQTGDALHPDPDNPGGPYIAVLKNDLSSIRFSSTMLACGHVKLSDEGAAWRTVSAVVNGRHKVLFVCGAIPEQGCYTAPQPPPARNPLQPEFAGGATDGYVVVIDLGSAL